MFPAFPEKVTAEVEVQNQQGKDEHWWYSGTFETLSTFMFWNWESTFELWKMVDFDDHVFFLKVFQKGSNLQL